MSKLSTFLHSLKRRKGLLIIIIAALLLEMLSAAQYYFTHDLMDDELEKRAEMELTLKAILIKNTLNAGEDLLKNHLWDIRENLWQPDSAASAVRRMVMLGRHIQGGSVAFLPNYYPSRGRLYEPYVRRDGDSLVTDQIGGKLHDYTESVIYKTAIDSGGDRWTDPYVNHDSVRERVTTYSLPICDKEGNMAGVATIDVSLEWLNDTINSRHIYPSSFVMLLTEDGDAIIRPSEKHASRAVADNIISLINDSTVAHQKSRSGRSTVIDVNIGDRDALVFYANMRGKPHWQLAVIAYDDEVFAPLMHLRLRLLLLMLLAFGILFYMVTLFARDARKLQAKTMEQERMDGELRIASNIQQTLLPEMESAFNGTDEVCVEGCLIPAKAVGGDLYNAFIRDEKLFFCIGDASGKGIPSAIIMAIIQALFRNIGARESNPAHIMNRLNEGACRNNKTNTFVTLFIGVLDLPTGHLRYCNAGHEIPILISEKRASAGQEPETTECRLLDAKPNLPIGLFDDFSYEMQEMTMERGSTLFLYTDGLTEARDAQRSFFGKERVLRMMADGNTTAPKAIMENAIARWRAFAGDTEQSDDLTLLIVNYTPTVEQLILDEELTLHNDIKEVTALNNFVKQTAERLGIGKPLANKLRLAVEEAVVNVMEYAYPAGTTGDINLRVTSNGHRLKFTITDSGVSFNPTAVTSADTTLSAEERPVGGLGILLVRELMDSINYERTNGKNVLTLKVEY